MNGAPELTRIELIAIGHARTPYAQKLGVPRQAGLSRARSRIELDPERVGPEALRGLEQASHLWLIWAFSAHLGTGARDTVRPPRLGGQARLGVLATRSSFRPNPLGLSLVELVAVDYPRLEIRGADLLDGTPILDLKPYLPWAEARPDARCEWAMDPPPGIEVRLSPELHAQLGARADMIETQLAEAIVHDPRPAWATGSRAEPDRRWHTQVADFELTFSVDERGLLVHALCDPASLS